jgi:glycosyltransferase involved in cell wall biosynthesis
MPALVSILIPAYNVQDWIADAIESALAQTWTHTEIIVVDDGSQDLTLAIARSYESGRVKVVSQPNQGASAARNAALSICQGRYVQWLDGDDLLEPKKIATQMALAEVERDARTLLSSAWAHFMYRPTAARFVPGPLWHDLQPVDWVVRKWVHNAHMSLSTWLVSRELTEAAGSWNTSLSVDDDGEYFTRVVLRSGRIRFVSDARVFYRVVGTNRLSYIGTSRRKLESQLQSLTLQIAAVRAVEDSPRVRASFLTYLQTWLDYYYPEHPDMVDELKSLASTVGGSLTPSNVGWKYAWIDRLFGRSAAKQAQRHYNAGKTAVRRSFDRILSRVWEPS